MLQRFYEWILRLATGPRAMVTLVVVAFAESSFFPIPPDILIIPMVLADRRRAWAIAATATVASVVGGFLGYAIGYWLFGAVGEQILQFYGATAAFARFQASVADNAFWLIVAKGLTPIPYKIVTIACGVLHVGLLTFATASIICRSLRFFLLAGLLWYFGEPVRHFIEKRLTLVTTVFAVFLVGGFLALRYM